MEPWDHERLVEYGPQWAEDHAQDSQRLSIWPWSKGVRPDLLALNYEELYPMPNVNDMFGSAYLAASDIRGHRPVVTIEDVRQEAVQDKNGPATKWVVTFVGKTKRLILNKTNAQMISHHHGADTDAWKGRQIVLYVDLVDYQGRAVDGIRVAPVDATPPPPPPPPAQASPSVDVSDDEIPF